VVVLVSYTDQFTLEPTPDEELIWQYDIDDPGTGFSTPREYNSPPIPLGMTNLHFRADCIAVGAGPGGIGLNAKINDESNPLSTPVPGGNGSDFQWLFSPVGVSPVVGAFNEAYDLNTDHSTTSPGSSTEIGVNQYGQDPLIYGGIPSRSSYVIFTNTASRSSTIRISLYGTQRGTRLIVPVPLGTQIGDRVVVILLFQLPWGADSPYLATVPTPTVAMATPPSSYIRGNGSFAPFATKQWWSDYTHNHEFTGAFGNDVTLDGSGEFLPRAFEGGITVWPADPDNGIPFSFQQFHHGDQQTRNRGITFSRVDLSASLSNSTCSVIMGSCRFRAPALPAGWVEGDPLPLPVTEFSFYLDGGKLNRDVTSHMSSITLCLRNEPGTESYGAPYRRGNSDPNFSQVGDLFGELGSDITLTVNAYNQPNPGEIIAMPVPPTLRYLPADPTDLIITAFTYQGKAAWGNPLAEVEDVIELSTSNTRMLSLGIGGWQQDSGSELGWSPTYGNAFNGVDALGFTLAGVPLYGNIPFDSAGRHYMDPEYDDSFWDTPINTTNSFWYDPVLYPGWALSYVTPPSIRSDAWWAHYAFARGEIFAWRMTFDVPDDGYVLKDGIWEAWSSHGPSGPTYTYNPNTIYWWQQNFIPSFLMQYRTLYFGATHVYDQWNVDPHYQWGTLVNNSNSLSRFASGSHLGIPFNFGPQVFSGVFAAFDRPGTYANNPPGIHGTFRIRKTLYDGAMISGLRDMNAHPGDPALTSLSSVRETVTTGTGGNTPWLLGREVWVQPAGSRALTQELYDYQFDQIPPFLPVPTGRPIGGIFGGAPDVTYCFGTGFRFVWRDAGPGGLQFSNRASSISFAG